MKLDPEQFEWLHPVAGVHAVRCKCGMELDGLSMAKVLYECAAHKCPTINATFECTKDGDTLTHGFNPDDTIGDQVTEWLEKHSH